MNVANNNKPMNIMDMHVENYAPLSNGGPSNQEKQYYPYSHIGCDETGSGDFFGCWTGQQRCSPEQRRTGYCI